MSAFQDNITNHGVIIGSANKSIASTAVGSTGQVLQGNTGADPTYSTATYPSTATSTGTILRSNGTNWVATTSTYPNTNAVNTLMYASSANVLSALATANSGVLTTSSSGVPSIDTTNFQVLSTGVQMKGNNTNTAPPAGFIGEQIRSAVASGSAVSLSNGTTANITSISLTAGVWDISGVSQTTCTGTASSQNLSIVTTSATTGTAGDNQVFVSASTTTSINVHLCVPAWRLVLSSTTTVYLTATASFSAGSASAYGRISATRVG